MARHALLRPHNVVILLLMAFIFIPFIDLQSSQEARAQEMQSASKAMLSIDAPEFVLENGTITELEGDGLVPCDYEMGCEDEASWGFVIIFNIMLLCTFTVYLVLSNKILWLPESVAVIIAGLALGFLLELSGKSFVELTSFNPESFFLFLLPPVIFESGYNLHKGNFFVNLTSILIFAVIGTIISTFVVGFGLFFLGKWGIVFDLGFSDSMIFAALISAVDPVATLAIFQAFRVNQTLHYLVFGESVLNDAVSVVLYHTLTHFKTSHAEYNWTSCGAALGEFLVLSVSSIFIGVSMAVMTSLVFKHVHLAKYPSLELSVMFILAYMPYLITEALGLSGIMAILFYGIVASHYTHCNLSPLTQLTVQQSFRMLAFLAETAIFVYLGLAVFSFHHKFNMPLVMASTALILIGRALNIFPLAMVANRFRHVKISFGYQLIMWFSGLRGAIAFALALNVSGENARVIVTTTLFIVVFTIFVFGLGTQPLMRMLHIQFGDEASTPSAPGGNVHMSKTEEMDGTVSTAASTAGSAASPHSWFIDLDTRYFKPFLCSPHALRNAPVTNEELSALLATASSDDGTEGGSRRSLGD